MADHNPGRQKLKVYGGNLDGRRRAIMATHSIKAFREATGTGRDHLSETWNPQEVAQAMSAPGTVFVRPSVARPGTPWREFHGWSAPEGDEVKRDD